MIYIRHFPDGFLSFYSQSKFYSGWHQGNKKITCNSCCLIWGCHNRSLFWELEHIKQAPGEGFHLSPLKHFLSAGLWHAYLQCHSQTAWCLISANPKGVRGTAHRYLNKIIPSPNNVDGQQSGVHQRWGAPEVRFSVALPKGIYYIAFWKHLFRVQAFTPDPPMHSPRHSPVLFYFFLTVAVK